MRQLSDTPGSGQWRLTRGGRLLRAGSDPGRGRPGTASFPTRCPVFVTAVADVFSCGGALGGARSTTPGSCRSKSIHWWRGRMEGNDSVKEVRSRL